MAMQGNAGRKENVDLIYGSEAPISTKRNPYLMGFEDQRGQSRSSSARQTQSRGPRVGHSPNRQEKYDVERQAGNERKQSYIRGYGCCGDVGTGNVRKTARRAAQARRRKRVFMQRALTGIWIVCILVLISVSVFRNGKVSAGGEADGNDVLPAGNEEMSSYSGVMIQGLPAEEYAKHPAWTEDFLTPNDYSRPGDALESVDSIFVHYTANPGTSAAQNRSYFEWLKDTHETSASAHFIIGYEGEIIQCIPLDEIAYAVQSRNFDSVSIECCYLETDGSFTQETYDSLISLLRWLKDVYHLEAEDILRHYDCGGKKCPLYYTEHPDAWEELKKDVDKL